MSQPFQHKVDYEDDTNENNRNTNDSQPENDYFARHTEKEKDHKEDD